MAPLLSPVSAFCRFGVGAVAERPSARQRPMPAVRSFCSRAQPSAVSSAAVPAMPTASSSAARRSTQSPPSAPAATHSSRRERSATETRAMPARASTEPGAMSRAR